MTSCRLVHRSDGSGTTYIFTNYLSSVDSTWAAKVGTGKTVRWPAQSRGEGVAGNPASPTPSPHPLRHRLRRKRLLQRPRPPGRRHPATRPGTTSPPPGLHRRGRRPETRHHLHGILHRQPARRQQLPHQRLQLGPRLHPPAQPGGRRGPRHHAELAHPRLPVLRRRRRLRPPPLPDPATRPHHPPARHRPQRNPAAGELNDRLPGTG